MNIYKITLKVLSPLVTPLMGDTLFGHICWGILYNEGEDSLKAFLDLYENNEPPLILSDGFPKNKLPRPLLDPPLPTASPLKELQDAKKIKKQLFVPAEWLLVPSFDFSEKMLHSKIEEDTKKEEECKKKKKDKSVETIARMHNSINRLSNTVEEGALYSVSEIWFNEEEGKNFFDIYVLSTYQTERIKKLFEQALQAGYGADKSTGKGKIEIATIDDKLFLPTKGNRVMALASFVPSDNDEIKNLRANVKTKFGKLGGNYAIAGNPFKKPIVTYAAGATFDNNGEKPYCGSLLSNVHSEPQIRHHALAPVIRFTEKKET